MSTSPEGDATFFKTWKSTFVGHLGLQSMSYRVGTPCRNIAMETLYTPKYSMERSTVELSQV